MGKATEENKSNDYALSSLIKVSEILKSIKCQNIDTNKIPNTPKGAFSLISKKSYDYLTAENKRLQAELCNATKTIQTLQNSLKNTKKTNENKENLNKRTTNAKKTINPTNRNISFPSTLSRLSLDSVADDSFSCNKNHFSVKPSGASSESTSEINLKILIQKESDIRSLRLKIDELKKENTSLRSKISQMDNRDEKLKKRQIKSKNAVSLQEKPKPRDNFSSNPKTKPKRNKIDRSLKTSLADQKLMVKQKGIIRKSGVDKYRGKGLRLVAKKESAEAFSPERLTTKRFFRQKSRAGIERSVSEPKSKKALKLYRTPTKGGIRKRIPFNEAKDDVLSTVKFKKTRSMFGSQKSNLNVLGSVKRGDFKFSVKYDAIDKDSKTAFKMSCASQLNEAFLILSDKKEIWHNRVKMMLLIENIVVNSKSKLTKDQLYLLKNAMISQIYDLRSAVVKQVCKLLNCVGKTIPEEIIKFFGAILNAILSRVYTSIRAIRDPCVNSVKELVRNLGTVKCIKELLPYSTDPHPEVRKLIIEMVGVCIALKDKENLDKMEKYKISIEIALSSLIRDANEEVRRAADAAFEVFRNRWPESAKKMFESLGLSSKRFPNFVGIGK